MVIFESIIAHRSFKLPGERSLLADLGRFIPFTLGTYLTVKLGDLAYRGQLMHIFEGGRYSVLLLAELGCGVAIPILIFAIRPLREKTSLMFLAATLAILGVVLNRLNVFLFGYSPLDRTATYFPSLGEFAVTIGFIAMTVMIYRFFAINLPVIEQLEPGHHGHGGHAEHGHTAAAAHGGSSHSPQPASAPARESAAPVAAIEAIEHEELQAVGCGAATDADHHSPSRSTP
jgi:Ni/Fe-hydrogenase subunit HybB-like protein